MRLLGFLALPLTLSCMNAGAALAPLTVSGNQVLIGGQQGSLAGIGLFWSNSGWGGEKYYTPQTLAWLKTDWKASVVRIPMGVDEPNGYLGNASTPADPTNKDRVFAAIDAAIANDLYVIVDWHTHHAEDFQPQAIHVFVSFSSGPPRPTKLPVPHSVTNSAMPFFIAAWARSRMMFLWEPA